MEPTAPIFKCQIIYQLFYDAAKNKMLLKVIGHQNGILTLSKTVLEKKHKCDNLHNNIRHNDNEILHSQSNMKIQQSAKQLIHHIASISY